MVADDVYAALTLQIHLLRAYGTQHARQAAGECKRGHQMVSPAAWGPCSRAKLQWEHLHANNDARRAVQAQSCLQAHRDACRAKKFKRRTLLPIPHNQVQIVRTRDEPRAIVGERDRVDAAAMLVQCALATLQAADNAQPGRQCARSKIMRYDRLLLSLLKQTQHGCKAADAAVS